MVRKYMSKGMKRDKALEIAGISKNQFYHQSNHRKPGRRKSTITEKLNHQTKEKEKVQNEVVLLRAIHIKLDPDHAKWYRIITQSLQMEGYYINHKKLLRLMKEYDVLEERIRPTDKQYVRHKKVLPTSPLEIIEMDIKYFWIAGSQQYAFVLTIIDTFTRFVLYWTHGYSMKSPQVKLAWEFVIVHFLQPCKLELKDVIVEVRTDNGPQFESKATRDYLEENGIKHRFIRPYTPEENGHVESFHNTLTKALERDIFEDIHQLEARLKKFYTTYNNHRSHSSIRGIPPAIFWALYDLNKINVTKDESKFTVYYKLKVAYQEILMIPGINKYQHRAIHS